MQNRKYFHILLQTKHVLTRLRSATAVRFLEVYHPQNRNSRPVERHLKKKDVVKQQRKLIVTATLNIQHLLHYCSLDAAFQSLPA